MQVAGKAAFQYAGAGFGCVFSATPQNELPPVESRILQAARLIGITNLPFLLEVVGGSAHGQGVALRRAVVRHPVHGRVVEREHDDALQVEPHLAVHDGVHLTSSVRHGLVEVEANHGGRLLYRTRRGDLRRTAARGEVTRAPRLAPHTYAACSGGRGGTCLRLLGRGLVLLGRLSGGGGGGGRKDVDDRR